MEWEWSLGWLDMGMTMRSVVPLAGVLLIVQVPPRAVTRSRMTVRPKPSGVSGTMPRPSSWMRRCSSGTAATPFAAPLALPLADPPPFAPTARHVAFIDLHTGIGPYGFGEIMSNHMARDPGHKIMQRWWSSEATYFDDGTSSSYYVVGDTQIAVTQTLTNAQIAGITLEYGTIPRKEDMMNAVRAEACTIAFSTV